MTMRYLWVMLVISALLLAACGGGSDNTETSNNGSNTDAPAAQSGDRDFDIQFSGDVEATIPPGSAQAEFYATSTPHYELFFGQMSHSVFFTLSDTITTGTHDLEVRDELNPDQNATVEVGVAVNPESIAEGVEDYDDEINGSITLDAVGDVLSGSFEFTAVFVDTDDDQQEIRKTVTVTGTFSDLAVRQAE